MNRESIIINFVRENFKLLQQNVVPDELYKRIKHDYFYIKQKNIIGKPKDSEIAEIALFYMIRKNLIKSEEELSRILGLQFFSKNTHNPQLFFDSIKLKDPSTLVIIEPSQLEDEEYREKISNEIKERVLKENESFFREDRERYQKEIEEMKKQLATIPTILEAQEYGEPVLEKAEEPYKNEWWQVLDLKGDPFPLAEGLQKIDKSVYDSIVVRTEVFRKYANFAQHFQNEVFKNTILYGDFGSGKTAFFDYLKEVLLRNKILSVYVQLWPTNDTDTNIHHFEHELLDKLRAESKRYKIVPEEIEDSHQANIKKTLSTLCGSGGFKGVVVFVDDLHKNPKVFEAVIDFLSYLQIFTSNMIREDGLNLTIYIAGVPQWKTRISTDNRLSGSLIRGEDMPIVTEKDAYDMLNNRMIAFSKNPQKRNIIGTLFVRQVYSSLLKNNVTITFREFIRKALEEFRQEHFDNVLTVNPRAIPVETLHTIKNVLYSKPRLRYRFEGLLSRISNAHPENRQKCFELLGVTYLEGGILEDSSQAERNKWAFQQLERSGLIQFKHQNAQLKWVVNKELTDINQEITSKHGISMEEYLVPIYVGNPISKPLIEGPEFDILNELTKHVHDDEMVSLIRNAAKQHKHILEIDHAYIRDFAPSELVGQCSESLNYLTLCFLKMEGITLDQKQKNILHYWLQSCHQIPPLIELINQMEDNPASYDKHKANFILGLYKEAFASLVLYLKDQHEKNKIFHLSYNDLTCENIGVLDNARDQLLQKDYSALISALADHIEHKVKECIFALFLALYGNYEKRKLRYDEESQNKIRERIVKDEMKGSRAYNELEYLDKEDLRRLMTNISENGLQNWNEVFKSIFEQWDVNKISSYLEKVEKFSSQISNAKDRLLSANEHREINQFTTDTMAFLQNINNSYRKLITNSIYKEGAKYYFSLSKMLDKNKLGEIVVSQEEAERLVKKLSSVEEIELVLNDSKDMQIRYGFDFRKLIVVIAVLLRINDEKFEKTGTRIKIKDDRSPRFHLSIERKAVL